MAGTREKMTFSFRETGPPLPVEMFCKTEILAPPENKHRRPGESGKGLMFEDQIQSLEKAEGVERLLQEGADIRRQAAEQQAE